MDMNSYYKKMIPALVVVLALSGGSVWGEILGPTTPCVNVSTEYTFYNGTTYNPYVWQITNGTVQSYYASGNTYYVTVTWNSGAGTLNFKKHGVTYGSISVTAGGGGSVPTGSFTYASSCLLHQYTETTTITRTNTPPGGTTWYWQTSSTGTSTSIGSGASIVANAGETYYLRAFAGSCWIPGALAAGTIPSPPNATPGGTGCFNTAVVISASAPGSLPIRWYSACTGGSLLGTGATYTTPVLTANTVYFAAAYDAATGAESPRKLVTAVINPPYGPPTATAASSVTSTGFTANWTGTTAGYLDVSTASNFGEGSILVNYNNLYVTGSSAVVSSLSSGATYYYRIRSVYTGNGVTCTSTNSNVISQVTLVPTPVAQPPTVVTSNSFQANWNAAAGATSYLLDVAYDIGFNNHVIGYQNLSVNNAYASVTGLGAQASYYYRVRAVYSGVNSAYSNTITTVQIQGPSTVCMNESTTYTFSNGTTYAGSSWEITNGVIESSSAIGSNYSVDVYWTAPSGTLNFKWHSGIVVASFSASPLNPTPTGSFTYASSCSLHAYTETTTITRTGTPPSGTTWYWQTSPTGTETILGSGPSIVANAGSTYYLRAFSSCWGSSALATATIPLPPNNTPTSAGCMNQPIVLTASAPDGLAIRWYNACQGGTLLATGATYTTPPLSASVAYFVAAYDASTGGESPRKAISASVSPPFNGPDATAATNITDNSFTANWAGANVGMLEVSTDTSLLENVQSFFVFSNNKVVSGLEGGTLYYYRVRHYYAGPQLTCISPYSDTVTVLTVPRPPRTIPASEFSFNSFKANWEPSTGAAYYLLDVSTDVNFGSFVGGFNNYQVNTTNAVVGNLGSEDVYYYRVRAVNASGTSGFYNTQHVVTRDLNYVRSQEVFKPNVTSVSAIDALPIGKKSEAFSFLDGLGRPIQQVNVKQSPTSKDVVQPITYDPFGRDAVKYLPYTDGNTGWFKPEFVPRESPGYTNSSNPQYQFYQNTPKVATDTKPYAETIFESSPLNRVRKQGASGAVWQPTSDPADLNDKSVKMKYETNTGGEILLLSFNPSTGVLSCGQGTAAHFPAGTLSIVRSTDEQNNDVVEYKDHGGKVVCKFVQYTSSGTKKYAKTYYVYDDLGNLVLVLQPEAIKLIEGSN